MTRKSEGGGRVIASKATCAYNLGKKEWSHKADMLQLKAFHGAANSKPFVFGGRTENGRASSSAEDYDLDLNEWKKAPGLDVPRMGVGCATVSERIMFAYGMTPNVGKLYKAVDKVDINNPRRRS